MDQNSLPLGLSFALAQNPDAMRIYINLPEERKTEILEKARSVSSKDEMQSLVDGISAQEWR